MPDVTIHAAQGVELRPPGTLKGYDRNARTHDEAQIAALMAVFQDSGFTNPVLVDEDDVIVAGHGRAIAAQRLAMPVVPVIVLRGLGADQIKALRLSDNALGLRSAWDMDLLRHELGELRGAGLDLSLTGFELGEIEDIFASDRSRRDADPDAVPIAAPDPVSVPGDLWLLGQHRLLCGDATCAADVETVLAGAKPHLLVTDPPYGVEYTPDWRNGVRRSDGSLVAGRAIGEVLNDDRADWRDAWALFPGHVAYVWCASLTSDIVIQSLDACGFARRAQIVWNKGSLIIGRGHYHWKHEVCWYSVRKGATGHWNGSRTQSTVWDITHRSSETGHGTQKPVEAMRRPMENNAKPGDGVYEPFSGSGTTIVAAQMSGLKCYAIELNPTYVDVAVLRWQAFTGQVARHANGASYDEVKAERCALIA